jgi:TrpR-related protein YerC/YecD
MKRRDPQSAIGPRPGLEGPAGLLQALAGLRQPAEVAAFLQDLCTPAELEAMADRWRVVPLLLAEIPYREIHDRTGVSVTTIGRVARCLAGGAGGYRRAANNLKLHPRRTAPSASH